MSDKWTTEKLIEEALAFVASNMEFNVAVAALAEHYGVAATVDGIHFDKVRAQAAACRKVVALLKRD